MKEAQRYAFFDVDETIITFKSMMSFKEFLYDNSKKYQGMVGGIKKLYDKKTMEFFKKLNVNRLFLNRLYYRNLKGISLREIEQYVKQWYQKEKNERNPFFIEGVVEKLKFHKSNGYKIVVVSGSFMQLLAPIIKELDIDVCLATTLDNKNGILSGKINGLQMIGPGKAQAIQKFLAENPAEISQCYAYADHSSDIPMLETVGNACIVTGDKDLESYAVKKGWALVS